MRIQLLALCACGAAVPSGIVIEDPRDVTVHSNSTTCPLCGRRAAVPDALYQMIGEILTITPIATWTAAQIQERRQQLERVVKTEAATTTDLFKAVQDALPGSQRALSLRNWSRAEMIALITLLVNVMQCYLDHRH